MAREVRAGPAPDVTRASSEDHVGGDVVMGEDENNGGHPGSEGSDSRRRITTKREPREVRDERSTTAEQHIPRRILGKTTPHEHAVAVTTQEELDCSRDKTMRIANVENNALNWVSISSAGALDMRHCDFSAKSARDGMRHIIGSSEPDVIIGSDRDQNRRCRKKDKDHKEFLCEPYEAQVARGRYFVHELTSEVNSRMRCVAKVMAMPRTITNARRVGVRLQSTCASAPTRSGQRRQHNREGGTKRIMGSPSCSSNGGKIERGSWRRVNRKGRWKMRRGHAALFKKATKTRDKATCKKKWADTCAMMSRSCSACGNDGINKGGWLDPGLCAKARREEVEYIRRHKMYTRDSREICLCETGKAPIKT